MQPEPTAETLNVQAEKQSESRARKTVDRFLQRQSSGAGQEQALQEETIDFLLQLQERSCL